MFSHHSIPFSNQICCLVKFSNPANILIAFLCSDLDKILTVPFLRSRLAPVRFASRQHLSWSFCNGSKSMIRRVHPLGRSTDPQKSVRISTDSWSTESAPFWACISPRLLCPTTRYSRAEYKKVFYLDGV